MSRKQPSEDDQWDSDTTSGSPFTALDSPPESPYGPTPTDVSLTPQYRHEFLQEYGLRKKRLILQLMLALDEREYDAPRTTDRFKTALVGSFEQAYIIEAEVPVMPAALTEATTEAASHIVSLLEECADDPTDVGLQDRVLPLFVDSITDTLYAKIEQGVDGSATVSWSDDSDGGIAPEL